MAAKNATTSEPIEELLARRWSPRAFDRDRQVDSRTLVRLFEAARWAPSCFNEQPWRYLVFDRFQSEDDWGKALACLVESNQAWAAHAPVLLAAIADTMFSQTGKSNRWCHYDTGAASENLCLQATAMGLAAHQMGGFDATAVSTTFHIPERYEPIAMIAVGYAGDPQRLSERYRKSELAERMRRPVADFVFFNDWDNALTNTG